MSGVVFKSCEVAVLSSPEKPRINLSKAMPMLSKKFGAGTSLQATKSCVAMTWLRCLNVTVPTT